MNGHLLYNQICNDIEKEIASGALREGEALPTVNELCKRYGVSHITVLRAFQELSARGQVNKPGKRYVVASAQNAGFQAPRGIICSLMRRLTPHNPVDNYTNDINCGIQQECCSHNYCLLSIPQQANLLAEEGGDHPSEYILTGLRHGAFAVANKVDGFLFDARIPDATVKLILERTGKPGVILDRASKLDIDAVTPPNREAIKIICQTAYRYGYRRFLFLRNTCEDYNACERLAAFREFASSLSASDWRVAEDWTTWPKEKMLPGFYRAFDELRGDAPVAIINSSESFARNALVLLKEHGAELHRDYGMGCVGGFSTAFSYSPKLTTVQVDPLELGRLAVRQLLKRIRGSGEPSLVTTSEPLLYCGETL